MLIMRSYSAHHKDLTVELRPSDDPTLLDTPSAELITYMAIIHSTTRTLNYYWNKLLQVIRELDTLTRFKKELETHIFENSN